MTPNRSTANIFFGVLCMVQMSACSAHEVGGKTVEQAFEGNSGAAIIAGAACRGGVSEVKRLVTSGVDPNTQGLEGITPLIWAITCQNPSGVMALLKSGANPDLGGRDSAPLYVAATYDSSELPKLLLEYKANPYTPRREGREDAMNAAIHTYMRTRNPDVIIALLEHGYDINTRDPADFGVADNLAALGQLSLVIDLIERGYKPDKSNLIRWMNARDYDDEHARLKAKIITLLGADS